MIAAVLREQGVPESAITLVPDEQEAIDTALRMGQPGDLLLVFADALTRSWKQVTKFRAEPATGSPASTPAKKAPVTAAAEPTISAPTAPVSDDDVLHAAGFIRDERGLRFAGEAAD